MLYPKKSSEQIEKLMKQLKEDAGQTVSHSEEADDVSGRMPKETEDFRAEKDKDSGKEKKKSSQKKAKKTQQQTANQNDVLDMNALLKKKKDRE